MIGHSIELGIQTVAFIAAQNHIPLVYSMYSMNIKLWLTQLGMLTFGT